jgi:hypothetical protein
MYNWYSSPTLTDVTFSENSAESGGGGMADDYFSGSYADQYHLFR